MSEKTLEERVSILEAQVAMALAGSDCAQATADEALAASQLFLSRGLVPEG